MTTPSSPDRIKLFFNSDYTASTYAFDTTRKSALIAKAVTKALSDRVEIVDPRPFYSETERLIELVHSSEYVEAIRRGHPRSLATSQGFEWDDKMHTMAVAHSAGIVTAVHEAAEGRNSGSLSSGLHHASHGSGKGYCTYNGLAVAVRAALELGLVRILVIDFDAHAGGGTYSLCGGEITHIDLTVSPFDTYTVAADDSDSRFVVIDRPSEYASAMRDILAHLEGRSFDLAIYNAGMDPLNCGVEPSVLAERERFVAEWLSSRGIPVVFTMAGGYSGTSLSMSEVAELHLETVTSFAASRS